MYARFLREVFGDEAEPHGRRPGSPAAIFGLVDGPGLCREHRRPSPGLPAVFFRYLRRNGVVASDPSAGLRNPKQPRRLPRLLRVDEVIRLLDAIPGDTAPSVRDRAMLETLYGGGLRVSELVGLNLDDFDLEQSS